MSFVVSSWADLAFVGLWLSFYLLARALRSRAYAAMGSVSLAVVVLISAALVRWMSGPIALGFRVFELSVFAHFFFLIRPRLRRWWYRALVSYPGLWFLGATMFALPWAVVSIFTEPVGWWIPFGLAVVGLVQSVRNPRSEVALDIDGRDMGPLQRTSTVSAGDGRELRVVQITDPHLGPFMSVARLRRICQRAVDAAPDLIFITGDMLTMESQRDPDALAAALAPLKDCAVPVYACYGNHDHEARDTVRRGFARVGVELLVDQSKVIDTAAGPLEILGADFVWRNRAEVMARLFAENPRHPGVPRILLLHDPGAFRHAPSGAADLTLSGHTHGGQVGLLSLGINLTMVSAFGVPDHGYWAKGTNRLYVHRATGHYGFPFRLGVPGEESVLRVRFSNQQAA